MRERERKKREVERGIFWVIFTQQLFLVMPRNLEATKKGKEHMHGWMFYMKMTRMRRIIFYGNGTDMTIPFFHSALRNKIFMSGFFSLPIKFTSRMLRTCGHVIGTQFWLIFSSWKRYSHFLNKNLIDAGRAKSLEKGKKLNARSEHQFETILRANKFRRKVDVLSCPWDRFCPFHLADYPFMTTAFWTRFGRERKRNRKTNFLASSFHSLGNLRKISEREISEGLV